MKLFIKNLLFTVIVPCTVAVYVPLFVFGRGTTETALEYRVVGVAFLVVGAAIYLWCVWDFASFGRGTPAPVDAPKRLVIRGLYRFTRNPMYIGVLSVIVGWAILFSSRSLAVYAIVVAGCFHLFVLHYEEPHLRKTFGASYEAYCSRVRRWLWFGHPDRVHP